jgi:hypothetical protein
MEQIELLDKREDFIQDLEEIKSRASEMLAQLEACQDLSPLNSEFTNTSPKRLIVRGGDLEVEVDTQAWCDLVAAVAHQLTAWHRKKMLDAARHKKFGTARKDYISTEFDEEAFNQPERIHKDVTVETRFKSGKAAGFIGEMLDYCGYDTQSAYIETKS